MGDSTLHVEPTAVRRGADDLGASGDEMSRLISSVNHLHDDLHRVWTGTAATVSHGKWEEAEPELMRHVERLKRQGEAIRVCVQTFVTTDRDAAEEQRRV